MLEGLTPPPEVACQYMKIPADLDLKHTPLEEFRGRIRGGGVRGFTPPPRRISRSAPGTISKRIIQGRSQAGAEEAATSSDSGAGKQKF